MPDQYRPTRLRTPNYQRPRIGQRRASGRSLDGLRSPAPHEQFPSQEANPDCRRSGGGSLYDYEFAASMFVDNKKLVGFVSQIPPFLELIDFLNYTMSITIIDKIK